MRILLDIGHPAHVHYFRNAIPLLENKGHQFLVTTRDKEVTLDLLRNYNLPYICTGRNMKGMWNKFISLLRNNRWIYKEARKFKPDVFISFFSPFAAQVGWILNKPVIGFTDTEFAKLSIRLTRPFTKYIFTPESFLTDFGRNHYRFQGYMENFYLHPQYFQPDESVLTRLGVEQDEKFFLLRFVSFTAGHDSGESGISEDYKIRLAELLAKKGKLFISSEGEMPSSLRRYKLKISPAEFHSVLSFASLYVGEGITTASECAQLGTPAVLINTLVPNYINRQVEAGLIYRFATAEEAFETVETIVNQPGSRDELLSRRNASLANTIDCTAFLVWLLDTFPNSIAQLETNKKVIIDNKNFSNLTSGYHSVN